MSRKERERSVYVCVCVCGPSLCNFASLLFLLPTEVECWTAPPQPSEQRKGGETEAILYASGEEAEGEAASVEEAVSAGGDG